MVKDLSANALRLVDCWVEQGPADQLMPGVEDVRLRDVRLVHSTVVGTRFRNVSIDGLTTDAHSQFMFANFFERVTIEGAIKGAGLVLSAKHPRPELEGQYLSRLVSATPGVEWSLDISRAIGAIEIRGYPASQIRRNTEFQRLARAADFENHELDSLDWGRSSFRVCIVQMLEQGWSDTLLIANERSARFADEMRTLDSLTDLGLLS